MMDPYQQLEMMQSMGLTMQPGSMPGSMASLNSGTSMLAAMSMQYSNPIARMSLPNVSPLGGMDFSGYGSFGMFASMAGNAFLSNAMTQQGLLPMGNAGSYMQAMRTREHLNMMNEVSGNIGGQDAGAYYRTMRGMANLAGMPFNATQRQAARGFADTLASYSPSLARIAPDFLDAIAGERGSVHSMAAQMMEANRYRVDPISGRMGFSAASNSEVIKGVFGQMFAEDNMAQMRGLRAGDMGSAYRELASEGLMSSGLSVRERTIRTLQRAREEGTNLAALGQEVGLNVNNDVNLAGLSNADLAKFRGNQGISSRMTKADVNQISEKLQGYVTSLSAMREVFGENGDPNAPMPKLINALKALTSGQLQRFDPGQLNVMVRDMQSMSQLSGKSIDQLVAMSQTANAANTQLLGSYGVHFNPAAVRVGATTGMAFAERGGAVGFGALSREQAEQASMGMFSRSMSSSMSNAMGVLTRLEQSGGFADNAAGQEMRAILSAVDRGESTYTFNGQTLNVPTRENDFRRLVGAGAVTGMGTSDFNMMLSQRTTNLRALFDNPDRQQAAFAQQAHEMNRAATRSFANQLVSNESLRGLSGPARGRAVSALSAAATDAIDNMELAQMQDPGQRNQIVSSAIQAAAAGQGITLSEDAAGRLADQAFGSRESVLGRFGFDATGFAQVYGKRMREGRAENAAIVTAQSGLNEAMGRLGPQGSLMQRFFTAMQHQGDRGPDANLQTLLGDMFTSDIAKDANKLTVPMQAIQEKHKEILALKDKLSGATPEDRVEIMDEIKKKTEELQKNILSVRSVAGGMGLLEQEGTFNRADIARGKTAEREIAQRARMEQTRLTVAASGGITSALIDPTDAMIDARTKELKEAMGGRADNTSSAQMRTYSKDMLLAESQLKAMGTLGMDSSLMTGDVNDPALAAALKSATPEARAQIVSQYMDRKNLEMYTGGNAGKNREAMQAYMASAAGKKMIADIDSNFDAMTDVRSEYLSDAKAVARGGAFGLMAVRRAQGAEDGLQALANDFYGGSVGRLLGSGGQAMTENGKKALATKFGQLSDPEKAEIVNRLKAGGRNVDGISSLNMDDYQAYLGLKAKDLLGDLQGATSDLAGAADMSYQNIIKPTQATRDMARTRIGAGATEDQVTGLQALSSAAAVKGINLDDMTKGMDLGAITAQIAAGQPVDVSKLSDEQQKLIAMAQGMRGLSGMSKEGLNSLSAISRLEPADIKVAADSLGMTPEAYRDAIRGGNVPGLMSPATHKKASDLRNVLEGAKAHEAQLAANLEKDPHNRNLRSQLQVARRRTDAAEAHQKKMMVEAGFDPNKENDVKLYNQQIEKQGEIQKLHKMRDTYQSERQKLKAQGLSDADIDKQLGTMKDVLESAEKTAADFRAKDMGSASLNTLADALSVTTAEDRQKLKGQFGTSAADRRNQAMVAGVLTDLKDNDKIGGKGVGALAKLDLLTDEYAQATTADAKSKLAERYGMSASKLEGMMSRTRFLGLGDSKDSPTAESLVERFRAASGRDIEAETRKEEANTLKITSGTLQVTGVVTGQGTVSDITAVGGAN